MIQELETPELPSEIKMNTHTFIENIDIKFSIDGKSDATIRKVDGYMKDGEFVRSENSIKITRVEGLNIDAEMKVEDIVSKVMLIVKEIEIQTKVAADKGKDLRLERGFIEKNAIDEIEKRLTNINNGE